MKALLYKISAILVAYGPWGILLLGVVDSVGIPLPAAMDVLLIGLAVGSVKAPHHALFAALMAVIGSTAGNIALYSAARRGAGWLKSEAPPGKRRRFREWFARYGMLTVFVPAVTPVPPLPLKVFVITADTYETADSELGPANVTFIKVEKSASGEEKAKVVRELGPENVVAIGNGANDALMLKEAALGIAVIGEEGCSAALMKEADLVVTDIMNALGLIAHPERLVATLRD